MFDKSAPCFEVDCVINFWSLANYAEMDPEEMFSLMWPEVDAYAEDMEGRYAIVDVYDKICYKGEDEVREMWENVKFYIEDCGYRFYDKAMFIF